jgi:ribosome-binding protein aMBF1 (putative translation factor)
MLDELRKEIEGRIHQIRAEINQLEAAQIALGDGSPRRSQRRRAATKAPRRATPRGRASATAPRKTTPRRRTRMSPQEREAQIVHAVRSAGAEGIRTADLAREVGLQPAYLSNLLNEIKGIDRPKRGLVVAK